MVVCRKKAEWTDHEKCSGSWIRFTVGMENSYF